MTIEQTKLIDIIGIENATGKVHLTISDHLPWDSQNHHLLLLQEKINFYLAFIESGEIYESYPDSKNREFVIVIKLLFQPNGDGVHFLDLAKQTIEGAGFEFSFGPLQSGYEEDR